MEAQRRATLLRDAQDAIQETQNALAALDKNDIKSALAALQRAAGKLDLVIARDPKLALAPVGVTTTILDVYATPDAVRADIKAVKDDLATNQVQAARLLLKDMASEADINIVNIPLATYPAAVKAVAPLIDAGKIEQAKVAIDTALNTLVIETAVIPLPEVRAEAVLAEADRLVAKSNRSQDENAAVKKLIEAARNEVQLAEALGYAAKEDYKPLYSQLDDVEKKVSAGESGKSLFDRLRQSLKNMKFRA
jgi:hypothetical protein